MKILFDANVPRPLRRELAGQNIVTAQGMGWGELRNGDLLRAAEEAGFDVLMTADQNLRYQQNLAARKMALLILPSNHLSVLRPLVPAILSTLATIQPGAFVEIPRA